MGEMINWYTLIKHNILSSASIWTVLPDRIREHQQLVLSINASLSQEVRYRCILNLGIVSQAQILVVPNLSQQVYQTLKFYYTMI